MFNSTVFSTRELIKMELSALSGDANEDIVAFALQLVENEAYFVAEAVAEAILCHRGFFTLATQEAFTRINRD